MARPYYGNVFDIKHVGNHDMVATLNPTAKLLPPPSSGGLPLGILDNNTPWFLNQQELHYLGYTGGTSLLTIGFRGSGKTAKIKKACLNESCRRNPITNRRQRIVVDDTRRNLDEQGRSFSEYQPLIEALGGTHFDLSGVQLNILDPKMKMGVFEQFDLVLSLCEVVADRQLTPSEQAALIIGVESMDRLMPDHASLRLLQTVMARMSNNDYELFQTRQLEAAISYIEDDVQRNQVKRYADERGLSSLGAIRSAAAVVSHMLLRLYQGYGGVFGSQQSLYDVLTSPVVGLDFTRLSEEAVPLVEMVMWSWRRSAQKFGGRDVDLAADFEIHDENWSRWSSLTYARNMVRHLKHIRGRGTRIWRAMHRISDIEQVGPAGSEQRAKALTGLRETDIVFIGQMERADHEQLQETFGAMPDSLLNRLPTLGTGQFVVRIGEAWTPFVLHVPLNRLELAVSRSDIARDAMLEIKRERQR